jgi:hypothetical protein
MEDFIMMNAGEFPELVTYMGFSGEMDEDEQENDKNNN